MTHAVWYGGQRGSWSQTIVEWLVGGFHHHTRVDTVPSTEGAVVCVKADSIGPNHDAFRSLCYEIKKLRWAVVIIVSNEEGTFPSTALYEACGLGRTKIWLQSRSLCQFAHRYIPWGWTPAKARFGFIKKLDWTFMGQVTHERRIACAEAFKDLPCGFMVKTEGFAQGLPPDLYHEALSVARMVPCPSGPITVDSFRVCEALQMGAIPMLDTRSPWGEDGGYWDQVFDVHPLPLIHHWAAAPALMDEWLKTWPTRQKIVMDWWIWQKAVWKRTLAAHMKELDGTL